VSKPNYVCSLCKRDFSRKSNANRHDLNQHQGFAEIIPVGDHILREKNFVAKTKYRNEGLSDVDPKEVPLINILEKLVPKFEEMERVLSNPNLKEKEMLCSQAIINAISSPDPIRAMTRSVAAARKGRSVHQMISYVALSLGVSPIKAREILRNMIV
jgi:hypothetical protein